MIDKKLMVLGDIAKTLNDHDVVWALGGSLLLYLKNKTDKFDDIDIVVDLKDAQKAKRLLLEMGSLEPANVVKQYKTKYFFEFIIDDVAVDVMSGWVIVCDGKDYECYFTKENIQEYIKIHNQDVPLQSLEDWKRYYKLMGREEKVKMLEV